MPFLYLVRHGSTELNEQNKLRSWINVPLSAEGREDAKEVGQFFKNKKVDEIFSSDLIRAKQTALAIGKVVGVDVQPHEALRPINYGKLNGKSLDKVGGLLDQFTQIWKKDPHYTNFGSESFAHFQDRLIKFIGSIQNTKKDTIIATHLRDCIWLIAHVINDGKPLKGDTLAYMETAGQDVGAVTIFEKGKKMRIISQMHHITEEFDDKQKSA